ncbi:riboflavin synthase [Lactococcus garvieae]|jgi:riboflavin synthase|uniref:Riboflavin synthase n=1 Tax=Lactococcus garvieae DCC43 TaxID=1231377 RepID=K2PKM0_9LACT|nr:riboflavin synthase [Lactococcus garvieae]EKF51920.1 Riboflavin synthase alpha chain [Lactococcus garvieae DCC43]QPS71166.1 riboflavin synthase [Lactococcus garvieae]
MFTGIIEEMGKVVSISHHAKSSKITINAKKIFHDLALGDSVSTNGVCLTVSSLTNSQFTADIMSESLKRSNLGSLRVGNLVNLERAMPMNGRFGGHVVSGHIDGEGKITKIKKEANATWYTIEAQNNIMDYVVEKGSIAIDGISLTIASLTPSSFKVSMIPHTISNTIFKDKKIGDKVNLESDIFAKYIEKFIFNDNSKNERMTKTKLTQFGF